MEDQPVPLREQVAALSNVYRLLLERLDDHERNHALQATFPTDDMRAIHEDLQAVKARVERVERTLDGFRKAVSDAD